MEVECENICNVDVSGFYECAFLHTFLSNNIGMAWSWMCDGVSAELILFDTIVVLVL